MRRFIARANIKHLRARLEAEVEPKARALVTKLLVEEEDKLGADFELLAELDQHVRTGHERIARQAVLVDAMAQCLHEGYRKRVLIRIGDSES